MKILLDMHTHTYASGHAYSTINENIAAAKAAGLEALGITDHGPDMTGASTSFYFSNFRVIPREYDGLRLFMGTELNIMDEHGKVDLPEWILQEMDVVVASFHSPCMPPMLGIEKTTQAAIAAIKNPYINILGHPDDGEYPMDYEAVVKAAKEYHTLIEINNSSLNPNGFRKNTRENSKTILELCKLYQVPVIMDSDAHICYDIGRMPYSEALIKETGFPEELVANHNTELFYECLRHNKNGSKNF